MLLFTIVMSLLSVLYFAYRGHDAEVRATHLESQLDSYRRNELRLQSELRVAKKLIKSLGAEPPKDA